MGDWEYRTNRAREPSEEMSRSQLVFFILITSRMKQSQMEKTAAFPDRTLSRNLPSLVQLEEKEPMAKASSSLTFIFFIFTITSGGKPSIRPILQMPMAATEQTPAREWGKRTRQLHGEASRALKMSILEPLWQIIWTYLGAIFHGINT